MKPFCAVVLLCISTAVVAQQSLEIKRRLQISVRFDDSLDASQRDLGASGTISNRGASVELRAGETDRRGEGRVDQRVQALDGGRATIFMGQSRPVRQRQYIKTPAGVVSQEVTVIQDLTAGFEVIPRLSGNLVSVDILAGSGSTAVSATASGRLGEWFELGAVASPSGSRRVSVKVDALD